LFKDIYIRHFNDKNNRRRLREEHYYRVKIYHDRGVEQFLEGAIRYPKNLRVVNIQARTIKPDGQIVPVEESEIFSNVLEKTEDSTFVEKAFAFKQLQPGDIVEVKYTISGKARAFNGLFFYRDIIPIRKLNATLSVFPDIGHYMISRGISDDEWKQESTIKYSLELTNLEASDVEPYGPPRIHCEPNTLVNYHFYSVIPKDFWNSFSKQLHNDYKYNLQKNKAVKAKAKELIEGIDADLDQLKALYDFCQQEITNLDYAYGIYTEDELEDLRWQNEIPIETLEKRIWYSIRHSLPVCGDGKKRGVQNKNGCYD
jgi:hypothetical protein